MTNLIATDLQGQQIDSPIIDLFEVTLPDGSIVYFHPGKDDNLNDVQFKSATPDGNGDYSVKTYTAIPAVIDGLEMQADGATSRPSISIANISTTILGSSGLKYRDLVGGDIVRRQTLEKYLVGGSSYDSTASSPPVELSSVKYKIDRLATESNIVVVFELAVAYDLQNIQLPRRVVVGKYCSWNYQGRSIFNTGGCSASLSGEQQYVDGNTTYTSTFKFDKNDNPLVSASDLTEGATSSWASGTSYDTQDYVKTSSPTQFWLAILDHTSSAQTNPTTALGKTYWKEARRYSAYNASSTYAVGDLVSQNITINGKTFMAVFECILGNTSSTPNRTPALASSYWNRVDLCGKTLSSCKCRFNSVPKTPLSNSTLPSGLKQNNDPLPFGAFPGTGRF